MFDRNWQTVLTLAGLLAITVWTSESRAAEPQVVPQSPKPAFKANPALEKGARKATWPRYHLDTDQVTRLNLPNDERFDASALLLTPDGDLLTLQDRGSKIYKIKLPPKHGAADLALLPNVFTEEQLAGFAKEKFDRYDCEGLARDDQGRLYICEEANRWVLRFDPKKQAAERLEIDWSPVQKYFDPKDRNSSFEGIAVGGDRIYVANERNVGRLIVVDLKTLKIIDDFMVNPANSEAADVHYSDLSWHEGSLWVLLRESYVVLQVNPTTHKVIAEFDYRDVEKDPESLYYYLYPTGLMEGLAVDDKYIWLATDNNGLGRIRAPKDLRPTLFRCPRPDKKAKP